MTRIAPFDLDGLDLDRPETWPAEVHRAYQLGDMIAELIETDPELAEQLIRVLAEGLTDPGALDALRSMFPDDHPARRWLVPQ